MNEKLRRLALAVLCAVFLVSGCLLARDLIRSNREQETNHALAQQVQQARKAQMEEAAAMPDRPVSPYAQSGLLYQYDQLWQENNDLAGWMSIEDTDLNYPVMFTPQRPEKYLRRDFYGKRANGGCLFIGEGSGPDAPLVIVFGHNMRNGTMFGQLEQYRDPAYAQAHPVIRLDTMLQEREYQVIAAFNSQVYRVDDVDVFRYYQYSDLSDPDKFQQYLDGVMDAALYDTGVEASFGDRVLVLSTCDKQRTEHGRFVVVAKQISQDVELPEELLAKLPEEFLP